MTKLPLMHTMRELLTESLTIVMASLTRLELACWVVALVAAPKPLKVHADDMANRFARTLAGRA